MSATASPEPSAAAGQGGHEGRRWSVNPLLLTLVLALGVGLSAGLSWHDVLALVGQLFLDSRFMTLPVVLVVLVVGVLERHGLKQQAAALLQGQRRATAGAVLWLYHVMRAATSAVGLQIGGHASMVRPLVAPMAEGAAQAAGEALAPAARSRLRAHAAAAENLGNFFADDIIVAVGPVLLMQGVLLGAGVEVSAWALGLWGVPTALWTLLVGTWRYRALDRWLARLPHEVKETAPGQQQPGSGDAR